MSTLNIVLKCCPVTLGVYTKTSLQASKRLFAQGPGRVTPLSSFSQEVEGAVRICVGHLCIHSSHGIAPGYLLGTGVFFWVFIILTVLGPMDVRNM